MKVLSQAQIYEADRITLQKQGISSEALMERAAEALFGWIHHNLQGAPVNIHIFCGIGNNGGDGLALARHLLEHGYHIEVYVVNYSEKRSEDFLINLARLKERKLWPTYLKEGSKPPQMGTADIVVDAIFGIGLNRPPAPWVLSIIEHLNESGNFIISVDIPSGLYMEQFPETFQTAIKASFVLTLGSPKLIFFLPQTGIFIKEWEVLDIGLDREFLNGLQTRFRLFGKPEARSLYRGRQRFSHKGHYGHVLLVGGSYGKVGALALASKASLKTGAGLVTAYTAQCGYLPLQCSQPEIMVETCTAEKEIDVFPELSERYTYGAGMGMGTSEGMQKAFIKWLEEHRKPLLIDADGLNALSKFPSALKHLPADSILTPHPGEMERLTGAWKNDFDKIEKAWAFAEEYNCILVLKGAYTLIMGHGQGFINIHGNPGMSTAGSGDVLSGMITALLAQGYPPLEAACLGVYLHSKAGDLLLPETGYEALTATSLIHGISLAFLDLFRAEEEQETPEEEPGQE